MESFEEITQRHVIGYRPAEGRVSALRRRMLNPEVPEQTHEEYQKESKTEMALHLGSLFTGYGGLLGFLGLATFGADHGHIATSLQPLGFACLSLLPVAGALFGGSHAVRARDQKRRYGSRAQWVTVPADVAQAYAAFGRVPERLRALGAAEEVVAAVEAQHPMMTDMLAEIARLTERDAIHSEAGCALRDRVVALSAQATALVEMDSRRNLLAISAPDAEFLLALPAARLDDAAQVVADETTRLTEVLGAGAADRVLPHGGSAPVSPA